MKRSMALLLVIMCIAGCATVPVLKEPIKKQETVNVAMDALWPDLVTIVTEGGNIINVADKPSGVIAFKKILKKDEVRKYALEKAPGLIGYNKGDAYVTIRAKAIDDKSTSITITSQIQGFITAGYTRQQFTYDLSSNGQLEKDLFNIIKAQCGEVDYKWMENNTEK